MSPRHAHRSAHGPRFGVICAPVAEAGSPDAAAYREVMEDCRMAATLGYDSVWMIEHHFSDYFPCPSPVVFLSHVAAHFPYLGLGTSVLVSPWYNPVRLAGEISMLAQLSKGDLYIGIGRGTAKMEYDAFGVDMADARARFQESYDIMRRLLDGETVTHESTHYSIPRPVRLRPDPVPNRSRIRFYGAVGSPQSARIFAGMGLPMICASNFPLSMFREMRREWEQTAAPAARKHSGGPIAVHTFIADTDKQAVEMAREYLPPFFRQQTVHYEVDANHWSGIEGFEQFSRFFANLKKLTSPDQLQPWLDWQFVGSPRTVAQRLRGYLDAGFDHIVLHTSTPYIPRAIRHESMSRFAEEVLPLMAENSVAA